MFDDSTLEKIFTHPETRHISIAELSTMIHIIEEVLEQMEVEKNAVSKS